MAESVDALKERLAYLEQTIESLKKWERRSWFKRTFNRWIPPRKPVSTHYAPIRQIETKVEDKDKAVPFAYATPRMVTDLTQCCFYHTVDLPTVGTVKGHWDLRGRIGEYLGRIDVAGRRVLDLGTASGFLTFEMEKQGAHVVSFDADSSERFAFLPMHSHDSVTKREEWYALHEGVLNTTKNSYWLSHRLHNSSAQAYYGNVYNLPGELGMFDVVVVAQILIHLRDPIMALTQAANRSARHLVIAEGMIDSPEADMRLCGSMKNGIPYAWFKLSTTLYREVLEMLGFRIIRQTTASYSCSDSQHDNQIPITTIIAERVQTTA
ncbi:hypothetical protein DB346_06840 [Verrucomicrobia bacterium LW23]|nr:hypothetical protein DB346_06840 [Verrucomicrobia bacterium LW23]